MLKNINIETILFLDIETVPMVRKYDDLPEQAFYMVGTIDEVIEKAKKLAA